MNSTSTRLPTPEGPGAGHRLGEQAPAQKLDASTAFLTPYRENGGGLR
jgi:hypothetical protein